MTTTSFRPGMPGHAHLRFRTTLAALGLGALAAWWSLQAGASTALANRFGPPYDAEVTADQTVVYTLPDRASPPVGPLPKGAIVVVVAEKQGGDEGWTRIPDGYLPTGDIAEKTEPWLAEVSAPSVSVYAKPNAKDAIRRTARQGQLLRVTGVSPGLDGDTGTWWATTEGYLALGTLRGVAPDNRWAAEWKVPDGAEAPNGWWGQMRGPANVRAGATTDAPIVGEFAGGERVKVLAEEDGQAVGGNPTWFRIDGGRFAGARVHGSLVARLPEPTPTTTGTDAPATGPWIAVDREANTLTLVRDGKAQFTTYVALGKAGVETPIGKHATFGKYRADDMTSASVPDATRSYDLPRVPFVQYYLDGGFAIHGTYWHDNFGTRESQGCINLTWGDAAYLFGQTAPEVPAGDQVKWIPKEQATPVLIVN